VGCLWDPLGFFGSFDPLLLLLLVKALTRSVPLGLKTLVLRNARGDRLSADAVQHMVAKHVALARQKCPSLVSKRVSPHVLRHAAAMKLLQAGVDRSLIAISLGHESLEATQIYLDANLAMKEEILEKTRPVESKPGRYQPDDQLLSLLKAL
jgi:integrase/recombinase XerD